MKTIRFISVVSCFAAMCLTSCIDGDNDNQALTPTEVTQCFNTVKGVHDGMLIYGAENIKDVSDKADTLDITWEVTTDSTMVIREFPTRLLANSVDSVKGKSLKEALMAAPDQDINCYIGFIKRSPVQFLLNPITPTYNLEVDGGTHKIQVAFYVNNTYSFGNFDLSSREFYIQLIEARIFMDEKETSYLTADTPFVLLKKGTK